MWFLTNDSVIMTCVWVFNDKIVLSMYRDLQNVHKTVAMLMNMNFKAQSNLHRQQAECVGKQRKPKLYFLLATFVITYL